MRAQQANIGTLVWNPRIGLDISFAHGGTYGGLLPGQKIEIYYNGVWVATTVMVNEQGYFYLKKFANINLIGSKVKV
ncbi:hypothetical protein FACS1894208_06380 [Clostridia bacterium]|nr:hypothetical protein FACS1894208_06380 [Clostridia bacterium]